MTKETDQSLIERFISKRHDYERFTLKLAALIEELLTEFGIEYQTIEKRAKTPSSLQSKVQRKEYGGNLDRIHDLAGVRLIMYLNADVERAAVMIDKYFSVDQEHSSDKRLEQPPDRFSYSSIHKVIKITDDRGIMPEWQRFANMRAEVQIRTVLEHAWAVISHKVQYKHESEIPQERQRQMNLLSALLESADNQFARIREEAKKAPEPTGLNKNAEVLTPHAVEQLLASTIVEQIARAAMTAGLTRTSVEYWQADGSYLLRAADVLGLSTTAELREGLQAPQDKMAKFFSSLRNRRGPLRGDQDFFAALLLVGRHYWKPSAAKAEGLWDHRLPATVLTVGREAFG